MTVIQSSLPHNTQKCIFWLRSRRPFRKLSKAFNIIGRSLLMQPVRKNRHLRKGAPTHMSTRTKVWLDILSRKAFTKQVADHSLMPWLD